MARCDRKVFAGSVGGRERCSNASHVRRPHWLEVRWPVASVSSGGMRGSAATRRSWMPPPRQRRTPWMAVWNREAWNGRRSARPLDRNINACIIEYRSKDRPVVRGPYDSIPSGPAARIRPPPQCKARLHYRSRDRSKIGRNHQGRFRRPASPPS